MSRRYGSAFFLSALCVSYAALCGTSFSANAAESDSKSDSKKQEKVSKEDSDSWRGQSIFERSRDEYKTDGARVGSFKLKPTVLLEEKYDTNIYATQAGDKEDLITKVAPAVALESDWSRHALNLTATGDAGFFSDNSRENYGDYSFGVSGRLDVLRETFILGSVTTARLHEDRGSPDARNTTSSPTEYTQNDANIGIIRRLRKFSLKLDGDYSDINYDNGETGAGALVFNNDRDRQEYKATARLGYEIIPEYEAFIKSVVNEREYDLSTVNRNSSGYEVVGGTAINLGGKTKGEVFAGYMQQDYDSPAFKDVHAPQFGGNVLWNITGLTSLKAGITRGVQETTTSGASSYTATIYSIGLEHEITYNILAGIKASYSTNEYESTNAISREDEINGVGAELRYLLNRNASVVGKYDYTKRDSNIVNQDYDRNQVSLGLKLAM